MLVLHFSKGILLFVSWCSLYCIGRGEYRAWTCRCNFWRVTKSTVWWITFHVPKDQTREERWAGEQEQVACGYYFLFFDLSFTTWKLMKCMIVISLWRPMEVSSRKPVSRFREVIQAPKHVSWLFPLLFVHYPKLWCLHWYCMKLNDSKRQISLWWSSSAS